MSNKSLYQIALTCIKGVGVTHARNLMEIMGDEESIFKGDVAQLSSIPGISRRLITEIRSPEVLRNAEKDAAEGIVNADFVNKYIDKIYVTPDGGDTVNLQIKIFTGEVFEGMLTRLKSRSNAGLEGAETLTGRTGHTFKKMIESYENSMK